MLHRDPLLVPRGRAALACVRGLGVDEAAEVRPAFARPLGLGRTAAASFPGAVNRTEARWTAVAATSYPATLAPRSAAPISSAPEPQNGSTTKSLRPMPAIRARPRPRSAGFSVGYRSAVPGPTARTDTRSTSSKSAGSLAGSPPARTRSGAGARHRDPDVTLSQVMGRTPDKAGSLQRLDGLGQAVGIGHHEGDPIGSHPRSGEGQ